MIIIEMGLKFNSLQLGRLSEILGNLALLFFASLVIPELFGANQINFSRMIVGFINGVACIIWSVIILRGGEK